jgi:hypothetical protein
MIIFMRLPLDDASAEMEYATTFEAIGKVDLIERRGNFMI